MFEKELRLSDQLQYDVVQDPEVTTTQYMQDLQQHMQVTQALLRDRQWDVRTQDNIEPLLYKPSDLVWLETCRKRKRENPKLQPKCVELYEILKCRSNHTYLLEQQGQRSWQNKCRLKPFRKCNEATGKASYRTELGNNPI